MQIGPARGESAAMDVVVTKSMTSKAAATARVYGSAALVEHMEQVCRVLLDPHLEDGEDAVGHGVDVTHRAPVPVGANITLTATVAEVRPQQLKCEVLVRQGGRLVARGSYSQKVVKVSEFDAEVAAAPA